MFRKFTHYKFDGPLHKEDKIAQKKDWEYQQQIILCGTKAIEVLLEMQLSDVQAADNDIFALRMTKRGHLDMTTNVTADSKIHYDETRKRNPAKNKRIFNHEDVIKTSSNSGNLSSTGYQSCEPDFQSDKDILIVLAPSDKAEEMRLAKDISEKTGDRKNVYFILAQLPDIKSSNGLPSWTFLSSFDVKVGGNTPLACLYEKDTYTKSFAKSVKDKINEIADKFSKNLTDDIEKQIKEDVIKGFADQLHKQADEFFEKPVYRR